VKAQLNHNLFMDFASGKDYGHNNFSTLYARMIMAF
jgi:hypothetical protein